MHPRAVTTREAKQMNLRSKFTDVKHLVLASGNHYRGPFILVGADAPVGLPCATQLSYLRVTFTAIKLEKYEID